jgi:hypothetical protein
MLEKRSLKRRLHWMSQGFAQTMCQNGCRPHSQGVQVGFQVFIGVAGMTIARDLIDLRKRSSRTFDVAFWHKADVARLSANVCF